MNKKLEKEVNPKPYNFREGRVQSEVAISVKSIVLYKALIS